MAADPEPRPNLGEVVVENTDDPVHLRDGEHGAAFGWAAVGRLAEANEQRPVATVVRCLRVASQVGHVEPRSLLAAKTEGVDRF
jgi:hypothetical protein